MVYISPPHAAVTVHNPVPGEDARRGLTLSPVKTQAVASVPRAARPWPCATPYLTPVKYFFVLLCLNNPTLTLTLTYGYVELHQT